VNPGIGRSNLWQDAELGDDPTVEVCRKRDSITGKLGFNIGATRADGWGWSRVQLDDDDAYAIATTILNTLKVSS
jgi:hypothetical protein